MFDQCWRKNPEIAPPKWREKAEELRKKEEDRKKYVETIDFNASIMYYQITNFINAQFSFCSSI